MTNDVISSTTVVAIQGNAINSSSPTDGYVLTWDGSDGYWIARSSGFKKEHFASTGTWVAPAGITNVIVIGAGGGGGGAGSGPYGLLGCGGGGSALQSTTYCSIVPGVSYTITIGSGGAGGVGGFGADGGDTTFGSLTTFCGAGRGGIAVKMDVYSTSNPNGMIQQVAQGGSGSQPSVINSQVGARNPIGGFIGGAVGTDSANYGGGGGGAAGPAGNGGAGGNGNNSGTGGSGSSASANSAAGGGGSGGSSSGSAATGGDGGSGFCYIIY